MPIGRTGLLGGAAVFIPASGSVNSVSLAAGTAKSISIPSGAANVRFSANTDFYATFDGTTAAVPGDVTNGSAACLNPDYRTLDGVTAISVISASGGIVTAEFWAN